MSSSDTRYSSAFSYDEIDIGRRGSRVHVGLTAIGMFLAAMLFVSFSLGILDAKSSLVFVVVIGLLMLPLVFVDPIHGLMVYALVAPLSPEYEFLGLSNLRVQDPLMIPIMLGVLLQALRSRRDLPQLRLMKPLLLYGTFAMICTGIGYVALPLNRPPNPIFVLKVFQYLILTFCMALSVRSRRHVWMIISAMLAGLVLQSLEFSLFPSRMGSRLVGTAASEKSNVLGVYLILSIAIAVGCIDRISHRGLLSLLGILLVITGYALISTLSRTSYISGAALLIASLFIMRRKLLPVCGLVLAAITFMMRPEYFSRAKTIGAVIGLSSDSSYNARLNAYSEIIERILSTPIGMLFGGGHGTFALSFADTQWGIELLYGGFLGLLVFIVLATACFHRATSVWYACRKRDDALGAASTGVLLAMVCAIVSTFGLTSWSAIRTAESIFLLLGLLMACQRLLDIEKLSSVGAQQKERFQSIG